MIKMNLFTWSKMLKEVYQTHRVTLDGINNQLNMIDQALYVLYMYLLGDCKKLSNIDYNNIRLAFRIISTYKDSQAKVKDANKNTMDIKKYPIKLKSIIINKINEYQKESHDNTSMKMSL